MKPRFAGSTVSSFFLASLILTLACGESRTEKLQRELSYEAKESTEKPKELPPDIPPHPQREKLAPLLNAIYSQDRLPDVTEAELESEATYELTPGVMAVIRLKPGLTPEQQTRAIIMGTAEADAWAYRPNARRPYAEQIHKIKRGYGDDQKDLILKAYADLKLLDFFNKPTSDEAIAKLPAEVKGTAEALKKEYVGNKQKVWDRWMDVKMYARRVVAADEPFRPVLRTIKQELGMKEPPPRTWTESMDGPFRAWAKSIAENEDLMAKLTNLDELKEREAFLNDTHSLWAVQGSEIVPDKAKNIKPDAKLGFGVLREDLGGGYNELTYVFTRKMSGAKLKYAFLQSIIYGSLLSDFQLLSTAGSDFAKRDEDNRLDLSTAVVPDKYDPLYAKCGSEAALDTFIVHYRSKFPLLEGLSPKTSNPEKVLNIAHDCVIEGARGDIHIPAKDDDKDVEGPAPGSRLGLYQMLARFESVDVNMAAMGSDEKTEEDEVIEDAEAVLKRIKAEKEAGKGIK